jgi:hypothetical protein
VRSSVRRRVRSLLGAAVVALVVSGNVAAATCVVHAKVCETLVIQASGPLTVYVQALSCIAGAGLSWDVRVTDGSRSVHVPVEDTPSLVPGRKVKVPSAGRWKLVVRMSNASPEPRCVSGESSTDPVTVLGVPTTPRPTPRPTPEPRPQRTPGPSSPLAVAPTASSPSSSGSPRPSASAAAAVRLPVAVPPYEGGDVSPEGGGGSGDDGPLAVLVFYALGIGGIELIALAIRRELKMRRRSRTPEAGA